MKASTQYSDLKGTAAAELSSRAAVDKFEFIADQLGLDKTRFKIVGIRLHGIPNSSITLICQDKQLSTADNDYMVEMYLDEDDGLVKGIFERFNVVLYDKHDERFSAIDQVHEVNFSDFHEEVDADEE